MDEELIEKRLDEIEVEIDRIKMILDELLTRIDVIGKGE